MWKPGRLTACRVVPPPAQAGVGGIQGHPGRIGLIDGRPGQGADPLDRVAGPLAGEAHGHRGERAELVPDPGLAGSIRLAATLGQDERRDVVLGRPRELDAPYAAHRT